MKTLRYRLLIVGSLAAIQSISYAAAAPSKNEESAFTQTTDRIKQLHADTKKLLEDIANKDTAQEQAKRKETKYHFKTNVITVGNQTKEISVLTDQTNNRSVSKVFTYWSDDTTKVPSLSIIYNPPSLLIGDALRLLTIFDVAQKFHQRDVCAQTEKEHFIHNGECTITVPPEIKPEE